MAYRTVDNPTGCFKEKDAGNWFTYRAADDWAKALGGTHIIDVNDPHGYPYRAAKVLKTVVYVCVDEDENGEPVWEKWHIAKHEFWVV